MSENVVNEDGTAKGTFQNSGGVLGKSRVTVQSDEQQQRPAAPAQPVVRQGGQTVRVTVNSDTGETVLSRSSATAAKAASGTDPIKATAIGSHGQRISLSDATEDTVVDLGGALGSTRASVWADLGYIVRNDNGRGYRVVGESLPSNVPAPVNKTDQPVQQKPAEVNPADAQGVPPTSAQSDAFQATLKPAVEAQIVATLAQGKAPDWAEIGRLAGEGESFSQQAEQRHGEMLAASAVVLKNVGVENGQAFQDWVVANRHEAGDAAIRGMMRNDVAPLAALGREYAQQRQTTIVNKIEQAGVSVTTDHGSHFLNISELERVAGVTIPRRQGKGDFSGHSTLIPLSEAIRLGYVSINE